MFGLVSLNTQLLAYQRIVKISKHEAYNFQNVAEELQLSESFYKNFWVLMKENKWNLRSIVRSIWEAKGFEEKINDFDYDFFFTLHDECSVEDKARRKKMRQQAEEIPELKALLWAHEADYFLMNLYNFGR